MARPRATCRARPARLPGYTALLIRQTWAPILAFGAATLKDIGTVRTVFSFTLVTAQNVDVLTVISSRQAGRANNNLTIAVYVPRCCCLCGTSDRIGHMLPLMR